MQAKRKCEEMIDTRKNYSTLSDRSWLYNKSRMIQAKYVESWIGSVGNIPDGPVLEVGPGCGEMAEQLSKYGLYMTQDVSGVCTYQKKLPEIGGGGYSVIYIAHVLEHLMSYQDVILSGRNAYSALVDGGLLIIQVPDLLRWGVDFWDVDLTHNIPFTRRRVRQFADLCGLSVEKMTMVCGPVVGALSYPISTAYRFGVSKLMLAFFPELSYRIRRSGYSLNGDILVAMRKKNS